MLTKDQITKAKTIQLSDNFTLYEAIKSDGHPNFVEWPTDEVVEKLDHFYKNVVQKIRDQWGKLRINSSYRNGTLNKAVGGERRSVHQIFYGGDYLGVAADIVPLESDIMEVYKWAFDNIEEIRCAIIYRNRSVTRTPFIHVDNGVFRKQRTLLEKTAPGVYVFFKE